MNRNWRTKRLLYCFLIILTALLPMYSCKKAKEGEKPAWAKKDIRDFNDADLERLYDQWEEDEEPLEPDELPEHLRSPPPLDMTQIDPNNPESILKLSKKGKTLMMFVSLTGSPTQEDLEETTKLWQSSLQNNHIPCDRFVIDANRAIFMFKDGALAWEAKDYIVEQERCKEVTIENKVYPGRHTEAAKKEEL